MRAMLLAAGRSTRLGALGQALPKPLAPICGYPAICYGLSACGRAGLRDVVVNLHHHGDLLRAALAQAGDGGAFGVNVSYSPEPELLGTGGGLALARERGLLGTGPVVVVNAKVVADVDLGAVIAAHVASRADATLVLRDDPDARRWGAIATDADGRVVKILDELGMTTARGAPVERMFTGIQVLGPAVLDRLRPVVSDSVRDGLIPALRDGADLRAVVLAGYFAEHSTPERYLDGNLALLREPALLRVPPGPLTGVDPTARVSPSATLVPPYRIAAGAVVDDGAVVGPEAVVGAGARVAPGVRVTRAILWPATTATTNLHQAVLTTNGPVPIPSTT